MTLDLEAEKIRRSPLRVTAAPGVRWPARPLDSCEWLRRRVALLEALVLVTTGDEREAVLAVLRRVRRAA